jgi:hypothetical protein
LHAWLNVSLSRSPAWPRLGVDVFPESILDFVFIACHHIQKQECAVMTRFAILASSALTLLIPVQALSQEAATNRYTMEKTESGFVRLDTLTGEMSICTQQAGQLVCRLAADERRAFEETLSELSARVESLETRLDALAPADKDTEIPDEAELDRAIGAMEKMMRRFFGMVEELQKEFDDTPKIPPEPIPDRT